MKNIEEYNKEIHIESIKYYLHKLDTRKYDVYKMNPTIFGKFGGGDYKVSDLDIILSIAQEEIINLGLKKINWEETFWKMEEGNHLEYEEYSDEVVSENNKDNTDNIDPYDIEEYDRVKSIYYMNIDLEDIVKGELKNFSSTINQREYKRSIMKLVRNNSKYKDLKNKRQLSSCVTKVLNKNEILYTFDLTQRVYKIFLESCEKNFDLVYDLLLDLDKDIEFTICKLNNISSNKRLEYIEYIDKLKEVKSIVGEMIECENFKENTNLKDDLLDVVSLKTEKKINKYINIKMNPRKYKSEVRTSSKESIRSKAKKLKSEGVSNNEIARRLGKSKGYISELLNGKK